MSSGVTEKLMGYPRLTKENINWKYYLQSLKLLIWKIAKGITTVNESKNTNTENNWDN